MSEVVRLGVEELLVDPSRFSPRAIAVEAEQLDQLAAALADGCELPPLRVARAAEPKADWCSCPQHWSQSKRAAYQARGRAIPFAHYPIAPTAILIDGLARYWAWRQAGTKAVPVVFDEAPVTGPADVLARALEANSRHGRRLTDLDLRRAFCRLWLGREPKDKYERWTPGPDALSATEIAARLGRGEAWCGAMMRCARVAYAIRLDLSQRALLALGRLDESEWHGFVWTWDGQLRAHPIVDERGVQTGELGTVPQMAARDLERLVDAVLRQLPGVERSIAPPVQAPLVAGPTVEDDGQYLLEFEWDAAVGAAEVRRVLAVVDRLHPQRLFEVYGGLQQVKAEATIACERAARRLRAAGLLTGG